MGPSNRKTHEMFVIRKQETSHDSIAGTNTNIYMGVFRRGDPDSA